MARQIQTVKSRAESVWGAVVCSLLGVAGVLRAPPLACPGGGLPKRKMKPNWFDVWP